MDIQDIQQLYAYNRWANACVLDSTAALTTEQFTRDLASSHSSVRDTLLHMLAAEWVWLRRWQGVSPREFLPPAEVPDLPTLRARWAEVEWEQKEFVALLTAADLAIVIGYTNTRGEQWRYALGHMLQHVVNHSSYHRGQVATLLRQLGATPVMTDFLAYFDANPQA